MITVFQKNDLFHNWMQLGLMNYQSVGKQLIDNEQSIKETISATILLVEDESCLREMLREYLINKGYNVIEASNGERALEELSLSKLSKRSIDLLFTDIEMPGMSGIELAQNIQRLSNNTKVLFTSGCLVEKAFNYGLLEPGVNFLPKPFQLSKVSPLIQKILYSNPVAR